MFILRLDDCSEYMNSEKWNRVFSLCDRNGIKPILGIIPNNEDPNLLKWGEYENFWKKMRELQSKGYTIALHGNSHKFSSNCAGINPVNKYSEFAGKAYSDQAEKIRKGIEKLKQEGITAKCFFAPAHTFDENTLLAIQNESEIRIIVDTIAYNTYFEKGFYFVPQQTGRPRALPFKLVTICLHPNNMSEQDYKELEVFLQKYKSRFVNLNCLEFKKRKRNIIDSVLRYLYFARR